MISEIKNKLIQAGVDDETAEKKAIEMCEKIKLQEKIEKDFACDDVQNMHYQFGFMVPFVQCILVGKSFGEAEAVVENSMKIFNKEIGNMNKSTEHSIKGMTRGIYELGKMIELFEELDLIKSALASGVHPKIIKLEGEQKIVH